MGKGSIRDLTGQKFGKLTALSYEIIPITKYGETQSKIRWKCECDCGKIIDAYTQGLVKGETFSCGCIKKLREVKIKDRFDAMTRSIFAQNVKARSKIFLKKDCLLTLEEYQILVKQNCAYCNSEPLSSRKDECPISDYVLKYNGIDRLDPALPYQRDNCVTACWICNQMKFKDTPEGFFDRIIRGNALPPFEQRKIFLLKPDLSIYTRQENLLWKNLFREKVYQPNKLLNASADFGIDEYVCLATSSCFYCGIPPSNKKSRDPHSVVYGGLDRKDPSLHYFLDNIVPCCKQCNWAKMDCDIHLILGRFKEIYDNLSLEKGIENASKLILSKRLV